MSRQHTLGNTISANGFNGDADRCVGQWKCPCANKIGTDQAGNWPWQSRPAFESRFGATDIRVAGNLDQRQRAGVEASPFRRPTTSCGNYIGTDAWE
jgi:hypothetical protein